MGTCKTCSFSEFAAQKSTSHAVTVIDTCLDAMDEGILDVCARSPMGCYLWETYLLSEQQWHRVCNLLQRFGMSNSILWRFGCSLTISELNMWAGIEYLWTDLVTVHMFLADFQRRHGYQQHCYIIADELEQRAWATSVRRAWLAAAVSCL